MSDPSKPNWFRRAWNWFDFWSRLEPAVLVTEDNKAQIQDAIRLMKPETRKFLADVWVRQNDGFSRDLESIRTRATSLLAATGVITGVLTLLVPVAPLIRTSFAPSSVVAIGLLVLAAAAFVAMIYCALGTVVLAVRAQEVDFWGQSELKPSSPSSKEAYELLYGFSLYVTYTDNVSRLRNPAGYLRQAQAYFRVLVFALAGLVVASVLAGAIGSLNTSNVKQPVSRQSSSPSTSSSASGTRMTP
jgi:hypothetical protein